MDLALKADAFFVRMKSDKAENSVETEADASRLRLVLEGGRRFALSDTATLRPTLELGVRHDGGDAETGAGVELGGGERGRGLSFSLAPTVGATSSASERMWGVHDARALTPDSEFEAARGLQAEAGYGLADGAARDRHLGWRLTSAVRGDPGFELNLDAARRETAGDGEAEHGVLLRGSVRW